MPTIYRMSRKSLQRNAIGPRDLELWVKHCDSKKVEAGDTPPVKKHPRRIKKN